MLHYHSHMSCACIILQLFHAAKKNVVIDDANQTQSKTCLSSSNSEITNLPELESLMEVNVNQKTSEPVLPSGDTLQPSTSSQQINIKAELWKRTKRLKVKQEILHTLARYKANKITCFEPKISFSDKIPANFLRKLETTSITL